ncbi:MAG: hypothetical protein QOD99_1106 [Chthoniobacter sp.]|jgi:hypothetical protein|nr:hypothetical protein [Chthoniobacter sp.]
MDFNLMLATSSPERAVWLSFGFYLLNLLVPIIPAVIIYRLFPEGKARRAGDGSSVEGSVGGWKIKAVGAWGAYVTAFVLGHWTINATAIPLIKAVGGASVWKIDSDFQLTDENGNEIDGTVEKLEVEPPMVVPWGKRATITVFSETLDPPENVRMKMEGYGYKTVDLQGAVTTNGKIKLAPIKLTKLSKTLSPPAPLAQPLPAGAGPAALTSN